MERLPRGRHIWTFARGDSAGGGTRRTWARATAVVGAATLAGVLLPGAVSGAATAGTPRSLHALLAEANRLSNQIDSLSQQYDGLKIQLDEARTEIKIAHETGLRDERAMAAGKSAVGQIAAQGYMAGGFSPTLQLLQSSDPQTLLDRASIMLQLQQENGDKVNVLAAAAAAAQRAQLTARQETTRAVRLQAVMRKKVAAIQVRENVLNSAAFSRAMTIYQRTGTYPNIHLPGNSIGVQALRHALTKIGDPYVWGGAGPNDFDCSGLVMWAYAQVGISLDHYTGDQWNEGEHISRSQLEPGDLVFFFADISHVGMYVGNGLMVDAPTFGEPVQIQPVYWSAYVGAVRIVA